MSLSRDIIDRTLRTKMGQSAYDVVEKLHDAGFECLWVGGAVRDMALGKVPTEIDIATSATPDDVVKIFRKCDETHKDLGAIIVSHGGEIFEITTYRTDSDSGDGRKPDTVSFTTRAKDALRRDATINALYFNPISREVFDDTGGLSDIKERLVRFIGSPEARIHEDGLRALRMIRLRATIDGQYEPKTYAAIAHAEEEVQALSGVRMFEEIEKMLACSHPDIAMKDLQDCGLLTCILPEVSACKGVAQPKEYHQEGDVFNHLICCITKFTSDHGPDVRLATLLHDIGKPKTFSLQERIRFDHHAEVSADAATLALTRLKVPGNRVKKIHWLIRHHMMMDSFQRLSAVRKSHWYFHPWFKELLELFWLDAAGTEPHSFELFDWIIADYNEFLNTHPRPAKPLLSGDEIMSILGIAPGEAVGEAMKKLHREQILKKITTAKEAREYVKKLRTITGSSQE